MKRKDKRIIALNSKFNLLHNSFFKKLFVIPYIIWLVWSFIMMFGQNEITNKFLWKELIIIDFYTLLIWLALSIVITLIFLKFGKLRLLKFFEENFVFLCLIINILLIPIISTGYNLKSTFQIIVFSFLLLSPTLISLILLTLKIKKKLKVKVVNLIQMIFILLFLPYLFLLFHVGMFWLVG